MTGAVMRCWYFSRFSALCLFPVFPDRLLPHPFLWSWRSRLARYSWHIRRIGGWGGVVPLPFPLFFLPVLLNGLVRPTCAALCLLAHFFNGGFGEFLRLLHRLRFIGLAVSALALGQLLSEFCCQLSAGIRLNAPAAFLLDLIMGVPLPWFLHGSPPVELRPTVGFHLLRASLIPAMM